MGVYSLCIPVPVHANDRTTAVVQQLAEDAAREAHPVLTPSFADWQEWINEWLELQPLLRFRGAEPSIQHPSALLYPEETDPSDWTLFWLHTRQIVFGTLMGLKMCSPYLNGSTAVPCRMKPETWAAWLQDVSWVFDVLLKQ